MFQNKHKLQCGGNERIFDNNNDVSSKRDIELCLEVEMDDEVRELITSPETCASTLLDVTVIKPKDIDQIYTAHKKTLNGEEVRKLINSMNLEKEEQKKVINKILCKDDNMVTIHQNSQSENRRNGHCLGSKDSAFFGYKKNLSTDDTSSGILSNFNQKRYKNYKNDGDHTRVEQVYTSPRTYNDLKAIFACKNRNRIDQNDKSNGPCLCQNCAIMGLIRDAQKRPFVTENMYDPREGRRPTNDKPKRKKSVNFREEMHPGCEYYFKYLASKIKTLEERIALQEEKCVSKEYFKKIITKLVGHISKITHGSQVEKVPSRTHRCKEYHHKCREKPFEGLGHRFQVNQLLIDPKYNKYPTDKKQNNPKQEPTLQQNAHDSFWKWGEEILKPGIDLKNKIIDLLEETLQNLRRPKENPSKAEGNIKSFVDDFSNRLYNTIHEVPVKDDQPKKKQKHGPNLKRVNSSSTISKHVDIPMRDLERKNAKLGNKLFNRKEVNVTREESLNISYFNPKIKGWQDDSQISFRFESDIDSTRLAEDNTGYKQEFINTISNTKEEDRIKLWESIWNQAKTNGQSRLDKVTIQIPDRKDLKKQKMVEIEYTIADLETLLAGKATSQKVDVGQKRNDKI